MTLRPLVGVQVFLSKSSFFGAYLQMYFPCEVAEIRYSITSIQYIILKRRSMFHQGAHMGCWGLCHKYLRLIAPKWAGHLGPK